MTGLDRMLSLDREEMSELDRELFLSDFKKITDEYFEGGQRPSLEITRSDDGFIVCVLFSARRVKKVKKPQ